MEGTTYLFSAKPGKFSKNRLSNQVISAGFICLKALFKNVLTYSC